MLMTDKNMDITALLGLTLDTITINDDEDEINFIATNGRMFKMYHTRDCCESVTVDDVIGDLNDLLHSPITLAEEVTNSETHPIDRACTNCSDSFTWTFYKLGTSKGDVTIRWYGESNGYYSEAVDFVEHPQ